MHQQPVEAFYVQPFLKKRQFNDRQVCRNKALFIGIFGLINASFYATTLGIDTVYGIFVVCCSAGVL
jgi:hypothetical protein